MYKVVRIFRDKGRRRTIKAGLTLQEAQAHCKDPETSWRTCTTATAKRRTKQHGLWFDDPERKLLALFLENLRPLLKGPPEKSGDLPWDDCKVAFSVDDGYEIWEKFQGEYWALELPTGWKPIEMDASGARCVMVFRIGGTVSHEDGIRVRGLLNRMELLSRAESRL